MREPDVTTLPGGERVASEPLRGVRSVALGLWIATGSRDEPRGRAGVSHFIEHLLFKGSERYGAQELAELFDAMGGELNAATSRETPRSRGALTGVGATREKQALSTGRRSRDASGSAGSSL